MSRCDRFRALSHENHCENVCKLGLHDGIGRFTCGEEAIDGWNSTAGARGLPSKVCLFIYLFTCKASSKNATHGVLKLINSLPLISGRSNAHTPSDLCNYLVAVTVEHGLTTNP